jgi:hypothetical protein
VTLTFIRARLLRVAEKVGKADPEPTKEAAEKLALSGVLKGRTFRCAVRALYFCHSEWASASATKVAAGAEAQGILDSTAARLKT